MVCRILKDNLPLCPAFHLVETGTLVGVVACEGFDKRKHMLAHLLVRGVGEFFVEFLTHELILIGNQESLAFPQGQERHPH